MPASASSTRLDGPPDLQELVELGRGGMGIVRLVRRPSGQLLVLKQLRPELSRDVTLRRMFVEEARIASLLRGAHVVQVVEAGIDPHGAPFMLMEWARGGSLQALASDGLDDELFVRVAADALLGLAEAHGATDASGAPLGVVHRDVSPHNVLVTTAGVAKVLDFGIAKAHDRALETSTGVVKGKPRYFAPEQAARLEVGQAADVFSAGVVIAEQFAHRRFWDGMTEPEVFHRLVSGDLPDLDVLAPEAPVAVRDLLRVMLAHEPSHRPSAADCAERLLRARPVSDDVRVRLGLRVQEAFAKELASVDAAVSRAGRRGAWTRKRWLTVGGLALLAAGGLGLQRSRNAALSNMNLPVPKVPACTGDGACGAEGRCTEAGTCESLVHPGCHVARCGASPDRRALFVGTMLPQSGPDGESFGLSNQRAAELGFSEINRLAGGVPDGHGGRRPVSVLACDDTLDASAEAHFLASRVPAVIGFGSSDEALSTFREAFLPRGTTVVSALNASPLLSQMPAGTPRRFYRVAPNATAFAEPMARAVVEMIAPEVLRGRTTAKLRIAVVREGNATGVAYAAAVLDELSSPDRRKAVDVRELALGEGDARARTLATLSHDAPHLVIAIGDGMMEKLVQPLEANLDGASRPLYLSTTPWEGQSVVTFLQSDTSRARRLFAMSWPTSGRALMGYVERTRETFGEVLTPFTASPGPYESAYLIAYAMAAGGTSGEGIARGIPRLLPAEGRPLVRVGPEEVVYGLARLEQGTALDLDGITSRLDFDPKTGDSKVAAVVLCTTFDARTRALGAFDSPIGPGAPLCPGRRANGLP